uniref:Uncharacterized protein n=1 Tax=Anguilla anguilla TaxID=7936 RepID=A0A0E9PA66_ANGAN
MSQSYRNKPGFSLIRLDGIPSRTLLDRFNVFLKITNKV